MLGNWIGVWVGRWLGGGSKSDPLPSGCRHTTINPLTLATTLTISGTSTLLVDTYSTSVTNLPTSTLLTITVTSTIIPEIC